MARCCAAAPGISASPSESNARYFNVIILGPESSPYEGLHPRLLGFAHVCMLSSACSLSLLLAGGLFKLELFLPEDYPMAAPKVPMCTAARSS